LSGALLAEQPGIVKANYPLNFRICNLQHAPANFDFWLFFAVDHNRCRETAPQLLISKVTITSGIIGFLNFTID